MNYTILIPSPSLRVGIVPSRNNQNHRFMDSLKFIETMSVADFKIKMGVERIDVKQNPNTGKCFFVYGCETGAVSERFLKGDITKPVISQVCSPETGDMFYMLHQQGDGGAPTLATL